MNASENKQHEKYGELSKRFCLIVSKIVRDTKWIEYKFFSLDAFT